ncbi:chromosome segregation SMC family protein [Leptolyngbya sp. 7M]|uniref:chromosome segregation SMC family protein n=1 Tax=Leptolyngbya sp. 7M TaxID=2812896 RepID=UPI001B8CB173|nr:AAA family ATPase [Leptolyngbya sp. 7M]QYO65684.1 AAA family ATPase [Leptolyngbya sp. 7M]
MFKLQRLEITGFKSFADHTEIVFTGNGITAVVGPNGCGKSNVSDAISWVLGEQRARSLRGGEMKDVVFQGTKNRKPSGMAEVVLHLIRDENVFDAEDSILEDIDETLSEIDELSVDVDALEAPQESESVAETAGSEMIASLPEANGVNGELVEVETVKAAQVGSAQVVERAVKTKRHWKPRTFALEFAPGEAVSVTRRLYLSGESEYLLNGKSCRLRDIQDLFAGTGLSGAHYAIIEQGRIGQILSAKPGDRRNLIEEAAGISKFRMRQRAAESRLESAKTNLGRISDIVSEVEKQANSLRRQAAKTRRFTVLQEEFRNLLRSLYTAEDRHFAVRIEQLNSSLKAAIDTEKKLAADVELQDEAVRRATHDARMAEEQLSEVRRQHAENALERDRTEREYRYQSEQIVALDHRNKTLRSETEAAEKRLQIAKAEQGRLEIEERKEAAEADESRTLLQEAEAFYSNKIDDVRKVEKEIEDRRAEQMRHSAAVERSDEIARQLTLNLERLHERSSGLSNEAMRAEETLQLHRSELDTTRSELSAERIKLDGLILEKNALTFETENARNSLRRAEENAQKINEELARARNRLETLQEIEDKRSVYSPPIQKIFAERSSFDVSVHGVLADHLNVAERYEKAVESVLGGYLQSVIVGSYDDARELSNWIASANAGRVPILIVPGIEDHEIARSDNEAPTTLGESLGTSRPIMEALRSAFPRELSGGLVSKINGVVPRLSGCNSIY